MAPNPELVQAIAAAPCLYVGEVGRLACATYKHPECAAAAVAKWAQGKRRPTADPYGPVMHAVGIAQWNAFADQFGTPE